MTGENDTPEVGGTPTDGSTDPTAGKTVAEIFGEIVWLMTQDPSCRDMSIGDLEEHVMPAILLRQFHITYAPVPTGHTVTGEAVRPVEAADDQTQAQLQPVAAQLFAMVSEAVAEQLNILPAGRLSLPLNDWRSGPQKRVIHTISPFGSIPGGEKTT